MERFLSMILDIAHVGHPILRRKADVVSKDELLSDETQAFIDDLIETMRHANGAGLAAPQVHVSRRICAIEVKDNPRYPYKPNFPLTVLVNPILTPKTTETFDNYEGCLSVPNLRGLCPRFTEIEVDALDRHGNPWRRTIKGLTAGTFQHECDHLDGKLFLDSVRDPATLTTWAEFERFHKDAFVERAKALVSKFGS
jgi:peptide deformylase